MRRVVREALHAGWEWGGFTGTTHARIVWPATGEHVAFGTTPSVASWKSLATRIEKLSGVVTHRKGNKRRSRKAVKPSGFTLTAANADAVAWHEAHDGEVHELLDRRERLIGRCRELARNRARLRDIPEQLLTIKHLEDELRRKCIPVTPFDPFTLAG